MRTARVSVPMLSALLSYLDLLFLIGAWLSQWGSILTQVFWAAEAHFEWGNEAAAPPFWHVTVFIGLVGVAVTNVLGARYFYQSGRLFLSVVAALDLDTPVLVVTQGRAYAEGGAPDLRGLRRRNALWRGLPCAAMSVYVALRVTAQEDICQIALIARLQSDPKFRGDFETQFPSGKQLALIRKVTYDENFGKYLKKVLGDSRCPISNVIVEPSTSFDRYLAVNGVLAVDAADVHQMEYNSAFQASWRPYVFDSAWAGIRKSSLYPLSKLGGLTKGGLEAMVGRAETNNWQVQWGRSNRKQLGVSVAIYSGRHTTWKFWTAAL
ncbi:unnamed protein product [Prorocentrum cordatum]|uniref:Uncharacterized protein n=1 Tax=Prorocentrum cordatum TaxID=2364126 RepID=A0ABN9WQD3_9DINO|nr:unnamed protein product [Polarella glacialis]